MRRPDDSPDVVRLVDASADAFEAGRLEEALARADEAVGLAPRSVAALHYRAAALAELGRLDEAVATYERALAEGKDDVEVLLGAAELYVNRLHGDEPDRETIERGLALARRGGRLARKAGDAGVAAELAWLEGAALNQLGRPDEALPRLAEAAAELPDAVDVLLEQGVALYELCRLDEARKVLVRAERLDPEEAWTHHQLGLVAERQGDAEEASRRFARARKLSPDEFPRPIALTPAAFDQAVEDALARLPDQVRRYLSNVAITVEDLPSEHDLLAADPPLSPSILGLFRGSPYGRNDAVDPWTHLPSSIALFQKNLERFARSRADLIEQIGITLIHEVGHFLGLDEDELYERGLD
jgi:predicted Zn-dependent protease with MMP-like domain/Flp pilus assembly protein TadD